MEAEVVNSDSVHGVFTAMGIERMDGNLASGHPSVLPTGAAYAYNSGSVTGTPRHLLSN